MVGSWPYLDILSQAGKALQGQIAKAYLVISDKDKKSS
jgi:hypothetical protein